MNKKSHLYFSNYLYSNYLYLRKTISKLLAMSQNFFIPPYD